MPFVEVWIDEPGCDGTCSASKEAEKLQARIDEAAHLIRSGYFDAALHALTDDTSVIVKSPQAIASAYDAWKRGRLAGFSNYGAEGPTP